MHVEASRLRFPEYLLLASLFLLPLGAAYELPVLIGAVAGGIALIRGHISFRAPQVRLALVLGLAYWLPQLFSAFDSVAPVKTWTEVAADLRFIPFLMYLAHTAPSLTSAQKLSSGIALIIAFWCMDALFQVVSGYGLGGAIANDRLSGIFGSDNLKLGGVIAVLSPFLMIEAWRWRGMLALIASVFILLVVILLAGARASWVAFLIAAALTFWHLLGTRRALLSLAAFTFLGLATSIIGYQISERFSHRVDRTAAALSGHSGAVDHALSGRLAIWQTAWRMGEAHPINGVGVRGFRYAYPDFSEANDQFLSEDGDQGAHHAHQILLELWSETGALGLLTWLLACLFAWRHWRNTDVAARHLAMPAAIALMVALFPINTHYAFYSAFWGLLMMWLLATWLHLMQPAPSQSPSA